MARGSAPAEIELPPFYVMTLPGLEAVAADELQRDCGAEIKKTDRSLVVFKLKTLTDKLLKIRTAEDVFALAWGTDSLTFRALDLPKITKWTSKEPDWKTLLKIHAQMRGQPKKKPTFHLVTQSFGPHVYSRKDAGKAMAEGLQRVIPNGYLPVEENAWLEIWLSMRFERAICGVRLSDRQMRHREYKTEHLPASLRPTMAAAMVRLAAATTGMKVLDPTCGAGTILAEQAELANQRRMHDIEIIGGDIDRNALGAAFTNVRRVGGANLCQWDARRLPLPHESIDRIISNPPFGKQLSSPDEIPELYERLAFEWDRVLKPGGRAVLLVAEQEALVEAVKKYRWQPQRQFQVEILGQDATISVWQK